MIKYTFKSGFATDFEYIASKNNAPTILYLHGFCSDCWGKKPETVKNFCLTKGVGFFRFDYAGHGTDRHNFINADFNIWKNQVLEVIDEAIVGDVICVGSSMGGWLSLIAAINRPERVKGVIGLAAAPNFVKRFSSLITDKQKEDLQKKGQFNYVNKDFTYMITQRFIDTAFQNCLPEDENSWPINAPVHFIQGMQDASLPWKYVLNFAHAVRSENVEVKLLKTSNHRLNDDNALNELNNSLINIVNI